MARPVLGIDRCFDARGAFDVRLRGCPLDPGGEPAAMPSYLGPVNPRLSTQPIGPTHSTWSVTVIGLTEYYRYAIVVPPDDCRSPTAYGAALRMASTTRIDVPLPASEGFVFLCIVGAAMGEDEGDGLAEHPTVVVARTDLTPPKLPAQISIVETHEAWRARFSTVGQEVAFHVYKAGPPDDIRCDDPAGYQPLYDTVIGLPKAIGPQLLCAIPYDAAQNAGPPFKRLFR